MSDGVTVQIDLWKGTMLVRVPYMGNGLEVRVWADEMGCNPVMSWAQWDYLVELVERERRGHQPDGKAGDDA